MQMLFQCEYLSSISNVFQEHFSGVCQFCAEDGVYLSWWVFYALIPKTLESLVTNLSFRFKILEKLVTCFY